MMLNEPLPPQPSKRDLDTLTDLIALLANPAATKARVEEFAVAAAALDQKIAGHERTRAEVADFKAKTQRELDDLVKATQERINREREAHDNSMATERVSVAADRTAAAAALSKAEADSTEAARIRAELARKARLLAEG